MAKSERNFGLDVMRATAILLVLFAHYFASTPFHLGGLPGVEIFFVLSGFLIGNILIRSLEKQGATGSTLLTFWLKRWFRTLPNYVFFLLFHLVVFVVVTAQLPPYWYLYPFFLQNFTHPNPGFFAESWSLAVEEWFYLLFPLLAIVLNASTKFRHRVFLAAALFFLVTPLILRCFACRVWDLQTVRMIVPFRLDTMMYGVMAAMAMNWLPRWWDRATTGWILAPAFALFGLGLLLVQYNAPWCTVICFPLIAFGAALALPCLKDLPRSPMLLPGVIEYISKVSYSAYLVHVPFFFFLEGMIAWGHTPMLVKLACRLLMMVGALLLSYVPYKFIEQPFLSLRQRVVGKETSSAAS